MANPERQILVVEDDQGIRQSMKDALESEGYQVETAENGAEGLQKIRQGPRPSIVLLDLMMPVMGGREFLSHVMADEELAPIPVLVVSAVADVDAAPGAVGFLRKPVDLDVLFEMISKHSK